MPLLLDTVFLHYFKSIPGLFTESLLPKSLHIEVRYYNKVVFGRVPYFVIKERCIIVCVIVNL